MGLEVSGAKQTSHAVKKKIPQDVKIEKGPKTCSDDGKNHGAKHVSGYVEKPEKKSKAENLCFNCRNHRHFAAKFPKRIMTKQEG